MSSPGLSILISLIENQLSRIDALTEKVIKLDPIDEDKTIHLAYELHNIYCAYEDLFKEIAKTFENEIEKASQYHKDLLTRMQIDIKTIRPKVISEESFEFLLELLGFRHVFRHAYNYNLSPQKVKDLKQRYVEKHPVIKKDIGKFLDFLEYTEGN